MTNSLKLMLNKKKLVFWRNSLEDSCLKLASEMLLEKRHNLGQLPRSRFSLHKGVLEPPTYLGKER